MLVGSELALDRAQIERTNNRKTAIQAKGSLQGYKFIRLVLKNIRKRKICGIDVLHALEFSNDKLGGVTDYQLELRGGDIDFEYRPEFGQYIYDMVDTERNRNFLASHLEYDFWDVQDPVVQYDVKNRYEKMKAEILAPKPPEKTLAEKFWDEARAEEQKALRVIRGEEKVEVVPQMQPVASVANTPEAPGYIPKPPKAKAPPKMIIPKRGWIPGRKRGPMSDEHFDKYKETRIKTLALKAERDAEAPIMDPESMMGVGVIKP